MVVAAKENGEWTSRSNQIKHFPWSKNQLIHIAKEAGFTDILCYGDYEFNEFNPLESNDLIMVCEVNEEIDDPYELYYEPKR
jgi:hypothetical protein